ncbi:hypothetical protein Dimus_003591, partial [Dionaea muscipula]
KCNKMQPTFSSTTTQHAWNPKPQKKKTVWQRVSIDKQKTPVTISAHDNGEPISLPTNSSDLSPQRPTPSLAHECTESVLTTTVIETNSNVSDKPNVADASGSVESP